MRGSWLTRFGKMIVLLAFLAGTQPLAVSMTAMASTDMVQLGPMAAANDCVRCDIAGMRGGLCHMICTPVSAMDSATIGDMATPASPSWSMSNTAMFGRVVRPSLAPPRIS